MSIKYIDSYSISDWWNFSAELSNATLSECLTGGHIAVEIDTDSSFEALAA